MFKYNNGKLSNGETEYIAEGNFLEDELVEEKDLEIIYQIGSKCGWYSIPYEIFKPYPNELRKRIIARKVTKEEGEKPDWKKEFRTQIINAWSFLRTENNGIPDNVVDFMKDQSLKALNNLT